MISWPASFRPTIGFRNVQNWVSLKKLSVKLSHKQFQILLHSQRGPEQSSFTSSRRSSIRRLHFTRQTDIYCFTATYWYALEFSEVKLIAHLSNPSPFVCPNCGLLFFGICDEDEQELI